MKYSHTPLALSVALSHLAGGGWIEIEGKIGVVQGVGSHLAGGGWIEIYQSTSNQFCHHRPTSQEVGGLKFRYQVKVLIGRKSHLAGGGWIEIPHTSGPTS